jgi:hypothetical protein
MDRKIMSLTVPDEGAEALRSLLDLGKSGIAALCRALEQTGPVLASPFLRAKSLQPYMAEAAASVEDLQDVLLGAVYPLHALRYQYDLSAEELHKLVSSALGKIDNWPEEYSQRWGELKESVLTLLKLDVVAVEAKGRELLSDRANRVHDLRIFSDVRPLFTEARDAIQANVLTNTLCIKYVERRHNRTTASSASSTSGRRSKHSCSPRKMASTPRIRPANDPG